MPARIFLVRIVFKNFNDVGEELQTKPSSPLKLGKPTWYLNNEEKW